MRFTRNRSSGLLLPHRVARRGLCEIGAGSPGFFAASGGGGGPPHEYWRVNGILVPGAYLNISELQFCVAGSAQTIQPSPWSSNTVAGGAFLNLFDGSLSTRAYWTESAAEGAGFHISVDFINPVAIDALKIGGFDTSTHYPTQVTLQYSDNGTSWTTQDSATGLTYPGNNTLSAEIEVAGGGATSHRYWRINGLAVTTYFNISELQFWSSGAQVPVPRNPLPSSEPADDFSALFDGNVTARAYWTAAVAEAGGFYIQCRFNPAVAINGLKIGQADDVTHYPSDITLQYSDDGSSWTTQDSATGLTGPGNNTLSALIDMSG